jgi:hypothetical protein
LLGKPVRPLDFQDCQRAFGQGGKTSVSDGKGAALATRAYLVSTGDYYLCPLSEKQFPREQRREQARRVWQGQRAVQPVYRPKEKPDDEDERVAEGFALEATLTAEAAGKVASWTERRWLVRSRASAEGQRQQLQRRLQWWGWCCC